MALVPELLFFRHDDIDEVVAVMAELTATGAGWLTFAPGFDENDLPPMAPLLSRLFSARGPTIPELSWVPRPPLATKGDPTSIGIRHGAGHARVVLTERGHGVPEGWVVLQDNPKRGLVVGIPDEAPPRAVLGWLIEATGVLCPLPLTGDWRAALYRTG